MSPFVEMLFCCATSLGWHAVCYLVTGCAHYSQSSFIKRCYLYWAMKAFFINAHSFSAVIDPCSVVGILYESCRCVWSLQRDISWRTFAFKYLQTPHLVLRTSLLQKFMYLNEGWSARSNNELSIQLKGSTDSCSGKLGAECLVEGEGGTLLPKHIFLPEYDLVSLL